MPNFTLTLPVITPMTKWFCIVGIILISCGQSEQETNLDENIVSTSDSLNSEISVYEIDMDSIRKLEGLGQNMIIKNILADYSDHDLSDSLLFVKSRLNYDGIFQHYSEEQDSLETDAYYNLENLCLRGYLDACAYVTYCDVFNFDNPMSREERHQEWLELAEQNNALAMFYLGTNPPDSKKHYSVYRDPSWLIKSCELGNIRACRELTLYYEHTEPNENKRTKYLNASLKAGDLRTNFDLSLLTLDQIMSSPSKEFFEQFKEQYSFVEHSWYSEERTYFKTGKLLFESDNKAFYELAASLIVFTSNRLDDAQEYLEENNINAKEFISVSGYVDFDSQLMEALENFCRVG
jgi:hypothetical protein